jgi:predicted protein tyrosine phosphatase
MLTRIIFISEESACAIVGRASAAVISITSTGSTIPALQAGWHSVLRLESDDVDPVTFPGANQDLRQMTTLQAKEIIAFVFGLPAWVRNLVIHCKSGISRSAGVAKALADNQGLRFPVDYKEYNRHVYKLVLCESQNRKLVT